MRLINTLAFVLFSFLLQAQSYYYSSGKKIALTEDSSVLFVKFKSREIRSDLFSQLLSRDVDTITFKGIASVKLSGSIAQKSAINSWKKDSVILYAWHALKLGDLPYDSHR